MSKANVWQCRNDRPIEMSFIFRRILGPLVLGWAPNNFVSGAQLAPSEKRLACIPVCVCVCVCVCLNVFLCLEAPKAHLQWYRVLKCHRKETDPRLRVSFERLGQLGIERTTVGYNANGTCIRQRVKLFWHSVRVFLVPDINSLIYHAFFYRLLIFL